jgi:hypothetical protein
MPETPSTPVPKEKVPPLAFVALLVLEPFPPPVANINVVAPLAIELVPADPDPAP